MTIDPHLRVFLINGNMAAGKSTIAQALAERLPKSIHLRGDIFRRMIVNGQAEMAIELSEEAAGQLQLRYQISTEVAKRYLEAGFTVVYQDIIIGSALAKVTASFQEYPLLVVVQCPRPAVIATRDAARIKTGYPNEASIKAFDEVLRTHPPSWLLVR